MTGYEAAKKSSVITSSNALTKTIATCVASDLPLRLRGEPQSFEIALHRA